MQRVERSGLIAAKESETAMETASEYQAFPATARHTTIIDLYAAEAKEKSFRQKDREEREARIALENEGKILTEEVSGRVCGGFSIHETAFGWNITHLKSGWATFMSRTAEGARMIALYLIENYTVEFQRLNIKDCLVENFKPLAERIEADTQLWNLRKLYAVSQRELDRRGRETQPKMQVIS